MIKKTCWTIFFQIVLTCLLALAYANDDTLAEEQRLRLTGSRGLLMGRGSSIGRSSSGLTSSLRRGRSIEEDMEAEEQRLRSMGSRGSSMGRVSSGLRRGRSIEEDMEAEEQRLRSMGSRGLSMGRVSSRGVLRG